MHFLAYPPPNFKCNLVFSNFWILYSISSLMVCGIVGDIQHSQQTEALQSGFMCLCLEFTTIGWPFALMYTSIVSNDNGKTSLKWLVHNVHPGAVYTPKFSPHFIPIISRLLVVYEHGMSTDA